MSYEDYWRNRSYEEKKSYLDKGRLVYCHPKDEEVFLKELKDQWDEEVVKV